MARQRGTACSSLRHDLAVLAEAGGVDQRLQLVAMLKRDLGLGHGDASLVPHLARAAATPPPSADGDRLDALHAGPRAIRHPIHEALLARLGAFGDFESAPGQKSVSYRRKKQFAMIGPATSTRVEPGLNIRSLPASPRLENLPPGQMCNYRVRLTDAAQVDAELLAWARAAYDAAG